MKPVSYWPAMNSGWAKSFSWKARLVRMPVTTYSDSARRMRETARSRVGAHTLSLEMSGS